MSGDYYSKMEFEFPFRKYQNIILNQVKSTYDKDKRFHIVAPPGSGKTIVGLELIKRFGEPAVVFAPTSTIQLQWKQKVKMFIPRHENIDINDIVSTDPTDLKLINIYTYQLISAPGENLTFIEEAATRAWLIELVQSGTCTDYEDAQNRIETLKKNNRKAYSKELSRFYKKQKDRLLRDKSFDGTQFLHENARKLIKDIVDHGVKTIVMDEVHHLLDYWALVIKELLRSIEGERLIGLTATPPLSAGNDELQNYLTLIGAIDFEIPTPAVVKEGNLAPYQDLVYFCNPTKKEKNFIDNIQDKFTQLVKDIGHKETFVNWLKQEIIVREVITEKTRTKTEWAHYFKKNPYFCIAAIKYLTQIQKLRLPKDIVIIEEMDKDIDIDDWAILLEEYSLNYLKISDDLEHHDEFNYIKRVLKQFGFILTERGLRKYRSPSDKVLALSESKNKAVIDILTTEMNSIGRKIRAVVITDFEVQSAVSKYLADVLDKEAGGAVRAFKYIANDPLTTKLEPVLVTGRKFLMDKDKIESLLPEMNKWREESGLNFNFKINETDYDKIVEVSGSGPDWKSNTYVRMATSLFERGHIRCIVGTRGLLGEGWDSLRLNTLIDLTSATTSMTVNQIRGRSIRLDPEWPDKVANNWDVVCIEQSFEQGERDFKRFLKKHSKFYGLGSRGKIVRGFSHVDERLAYEYYTLGFKRIGYKIYNQRMKSKAEKREKAYEQWKIGEEYSNFEFYATKLDQKDIKFKTVYTLKQSLKHIFRNLVMGIAMVTFYYFYFLQGVIEATSSYPILTVYLLGILAILVVAFNIKTAIKYIKKAFIELPVDSFVLDIGKAVAASLRESEIISPSTSIDNVRVVEDTNALYDVYLDYASEKDAQIFSQAFYQLLGPVTNQRYLVSRSEADIREGFYGPFWWVIRNAFGLLKQEKMAYHPVPDVLSVNKKRAKIFGRNWRRFVGGGKLIYTRSHEGVELLLKLRAYNHHSIKRMALEMWK